MPRTPTKPPIEDEHVLTIEEAAKFLRCSRSTLQRLYLSGEVRSVLISPRRRVFLKSDLVSYVRSASQ